MQTSFKASVAEVLRYEGGNSDDPHDHGGRTSRGITQREYDAWCRLKGRRQGDVWKATDDEVNDIYKSQYWDPYCDALPAGIDFLFFDMCVNCGRTSAVRQVQRALGDVRVDGMLGQVTMSRLKTHDPEALINMISIARRKFYRSLKQFPRYGRGWLNRVSKSEKFARSLATQKAVLATDWREEEVKKASFEEPAKPMINPEVATTAAAGSGGALSVMDQLKQTLEPYAYTIKYVEYALLGIAVAGIIFGIYGFAKRKKIASAM